MICLGEREYGIDESRRTDQALGKRTAGSRYLDGHRDIHARQKCDRARAEHDGKNIEREALARAEITH